MANLADWTAKIEAAETEKLSSTGKTKVLIHVAFGNAMHDTQVTNYFLWYATSFAAFLPLFDKAAGTSLMALPEFEGVITWRNKVAAHTSYVEPRKDNYATLHASLNMFPTWDRGQFVMGGFVTAGPTGTSTDKWKWSLSFTHKKLSEHLTRVLS